LGISFEMLSMLDKHKLFKPEGTRVLDIGCSHLYGAESEQISDFISRYRTTPHPRLRGLAELLACGSGFDPVTGGINDAYVGELLEAASMEYAALDIFPSFNTLLFDLNRQDLPREMQGTIDLVLNFGTTEHVINQFNAFKVIHDATRIGGHMVHNVPAVGYVDHGYITYTGRFFFDIAGFNNYDLVDFYYHLPGTTNNVYLSARNYASHFPILKERLDEIGVIKDATTLDEMVLPDIGFTVIYRKKSDAAFRGALDTSTSAGVASARVLGAYHGHDDGGKGLNGSNSARWSMKGTGTEMSADLGRLYEEVGDACLTFDDKISHLERAMSEVRDSLNSLRGEINALGAEQMAVVGTLQRDVGSLGAATKTLREDVATLGSLQQEVGSLSATTKLLREEMAVIKRLAWPARVLRSGLRRIRQ
jgi:hypothetical protein